MPWILATVVVLGFFSTLAHADVYTWIDHQGVAHFSDYPPGELPHHQVEIRPPSTLPMSENLGQGKRVSDIRDDVRALVSASDRPAGGNGSAAVKARARLQKTCDTYRRKLDRIQSQLRTGYSNDKGNSLRRQRRSVSQKLSRECILR